MRHAKYSILIGIILLLTAVGHAQIRRVNVSSDGAEANGGTGTYSISTDGLFVAFVSFATNLSSGPVSGNGDLFVHSLESGETVQATSMGAEILPGSISADGRYAAFSSLAPLVEGDTNEQYDVFVWDRVEEKVERISQSNQKQGLGFFGGGRHGVISAESRFVAFTSRAEDLVEDDKNGKGDVFVYDRSTRETSLVSVSSTGEQNDASSTNIWMSPDARFVAFVSSGGKAAGFDPPLAPCFCSRIFLRDRVAGTTVVLSDSQGATLDLPSVPTYSVSADGSSITFATELPNLVPEDNDNQSDVFVKDLQSGQISLVSVATGGEKGNARSANPVISSDGTRVAFESRANNLVPDDTNNRPDIFVHDRETGTTTRVSLANSGEQADQGSAAPSLPGGGIVAFRSSATNLVPNRVYGMDSDDTSEYVFAVEARTGQEVWRVKVGDLFQELYGDGPRSTPAIHGDRIYVLSSRGRLVALHTGNGAEIWKVDFQDVLESNLPGWGFSSSPLVLEEQLIVETGGSGTRAVSSFDTRTGHLNWSAKDDKIAYSSPQVMDFNGVRQLIFLTKTQLFALDTRGNELWSTPFGNPNGISPALPLFVAPDLIFVSASYDAGAKVVRMKPDGPSVSVETVWESRVMRNHFNAGVVQDHHVFGFDKAMFKCIDARNGEQQWVRRGLGKGSLIRADGMLIALSERGKLHLVEADATAYKELASHQVLSGRCWTQPSLADGRLYLRNMKEMVCLDFRQR